MLIFKETILMQVRKAAVFNILILIISSHSLNSFIYIIKTKLILIQKKKEVKKKLILLKTFTS